ncbi:hypothetical protein ACIBQ1_20525 [Nonomuraea sp. NPDC050153]
MIIYFTDAPGSAWAGTLPLLAYAPSVWWATQVFGDAVTAIVV